MKQPKHVAIIMDGNGRWAKARGYTRFYGHIRGARVAKSIIEHSAELGIEHLTLYAFSTENWFRPMAEVSFLMRLLARHLRKERDNLNKNNIRFRCIGDLTRLPAEVKAIVEETVETTKNNTGLTLVFALSYGSRQEITDAVKWIAQEVAAKRLNPAMISEETVADCLESSFLPDPDLLIRTSGECRLSNFLLWQIAYCELYLCEKYWPDFEKQDFERALTWYSQRERRFGRVSERSTNELTGDSVEWAKST